MHPFKMNFPHLGIFSLLLLFVITCAPTEPVTESDQPHTNLPEEVIDRTFANAGEPEAVAYPNPIDILNNEGYVSGYDEVRGNPAWVAHRVFAVDEYETIDRPSRFLIDFCTLMFTLISSSYPCYVQK